MEPLIASGGPSGSRFLKKAPQKLLLRGACIFLCFIAVFPIGFVYDSLGFFRQRRQKCPKDTASIYN
jgi:hypothetical protein